ncbi:MAG: SLOG family protein [Eubacteriales bacterium]
MNIQTPLPDFIVREQTCCFTGHRVLAAQVRADLTAAVDRRIKELYDAGYRYFMAGGALGFDMLAETEVLRAIRFDREIKLILALPCRDQTSKWERVPDYMAHLRKYKQILGQADYVLYISDFYHETCMMERNRFMVDHSSACIAYYRGAAHSGTGQTFRMAAADGLKLYNVWDDLPPSSAAL